MNVLIVKKYYRVTNGCKNFCTLFIYNEKNSIVLSTDRARVSRRVGRGSSMDASPHRSFSSNRPAHPRPIRRSPRRQSLPVHLHTGRWLLRGPAADTLPAPALWRRGRESANFPIYRRLSRSYRLPLAPMPPRYRSTGSDHARVRTVRPACIIGRQIRCR